MSAPADRGALVEAMARAICCRVGKCWLEGRSACEWLDFQRDAQSALTALDAAGVALVPVVATDAIEAPYYDAIPIAPGTETWAMAGIPSAAKMWALQVAASPYAPEARNAD